MSDAPGRCYWSRQDDGEEIMVPMCIGCAVYGPYQCTCNVPESRLEQAERGRSIAESEVNRLREKLYRSADRREVERLENQRLRRRIFDMEDQIMTSPLSRGTDSP